MAELQRNIFYFSRTHQIKFLISLWSNPCYSWSPPPPLLLRLAPWVRHDSRATAAARITPKTSAARRASVRETGWPLLLHTPNHISGNFLPRQGQPCMTPEIGADQNLCVKTKRPATDLVTLPENKCPVIHLFSCCMEKSIQKNQHPPGCVFVVSQHAATWKASFFYALWLYRWLWVYLSWPLLQGLSVILIQSLLQLSAACRQVT